MRRRVRRLGRKGGFPPIITILMYIGLLVTAIIVVAAIVISTRSAVNRPILSIVGEVYIVGNTAHFTIKNDGMAWFNGTVRVRSPYVHGETTASIPPEKSWSFEIPLEGSVPPDVYQFNIVIQCVGAAEFEVPATVLRG